MDKICEKNKCTACSACVASCNQNAITMQPDVAGYLYPVIDSYKCIDCKLCQKGCPVVNLVEFHNPKTAIAAYCRDEADRDSSASGGAATMAARYVIGQGGIVYGSVQINCTEIHHQRIARIEDIGLMKGSKYVHSEIGSTYQDCRNDLQAGKLVLFTGTPCQIAGLKSFLRKDYLNLVTMDLVCHGVPSMQLLQDNIDVVLRNNGKFSSKRDLKVFFRRKYRISNFSNLKYGFYVADIETVFPRDFYIAGFISGLFFRENCFGCQYARRERVGDLTIGDFWGLGATVPSSMNVLEGVSEVLVNTQKGREFFDKVKPLVVWEERTAEEAIRGNGQLNRPFDKPANYDKFQCLYRKEGYLAACNRYVRPYIFKELYVKPIRQKTLLFLHSLTPLVWLYRKFRKKSL